MIPSLVNFAPRQSEEIGAGQRCLACHDNGALQPARGIFQQRGILFTGKNAISWRLPLHLELSDLVCLAFLVRASQELSERADFFIDRR
jgi:hypothetical protein